MNRETLKNSIKDLAQQGRALRARIQATKGPERDALWNRKRAIGRKARVSLLAYGFLRGVPYRAIEPKRHDDGLLIPSVLLGAWAGDLGIRAIHDHQALAESSEHSRLRSMLGDLTNWLVRRADEPPETFWTPSRVKAWLEAPTPSVPDREGRHAVGG
jgi:hypothetical protein